MGKTNYELTLERMPAEFLKYDQRRMIDGFHLEHDAAYLYLPFLARRYRVQLDYYERALTQLTGKKVKERVIYSLALQQGIEV